MARGFNVSVRALNAEAINEGSLAAELEASGQLTELESDGLLGAAIAAAKDLCAALKDGPFLVEFSGVDRSQERGEDSSITVTVSSRYTVGDLAEPAATYVNETPKPSDPTEPAPEWAHEGEAPSINPFHPAESTVFAEPQQTNAFSATPPA